MGMNTKDEALKLALKRAFNLGQTYWQQADSEYTSQWKKAGVTLASFNQLVEDTIREALADSALGRMAENERELGLDYMEPAQQQQEPVAYASDVEFDDETEIIPAEQKGKLGTAGLRIPLYIKPPASKPWVGLTDEEMRDLEKQFNAERVRTSDEEYLIIYPSAYWSWMSAIEAKLREKNT